ncbi:MAG: tRNA pseudouridine(65) synthase TruC [Bacteriovoracaceae bacterium]
MIEILFEDPYYLIVNKPSGMFVHPYKEESQERETLMKIVKEQTGHYVYPIQRLDRPVSGIVLFALSSEAARKIQEEWSKDTTIKEYLCLARGEIESEGIFNFALTDENGVKKEAITKYWPLEIKNRLTFCRVQIQTGRKHQIRRHFARRCHGIIGDTAHGKGKINQFFRDHYGLHRIFLHCHFLSFIHPYSNQIIDIKCPLPEELSNVLKKAGFEIRSDEIYSSLPTRD